MGSSNKIDISRFDPTNASDDQIRMWLFAIIQAELEKDDADVDEELIDECSDCEAFLSHNNPEISKEQYAIGLERIKAKAQAVQAGGSSVTVQAKPKRRRFMRVAVYFLAAALAIAILTVGVVAAVSGSAAWEFISTNIRQIIGMNPGDTLENEKVTLIKGDLVAEYDSVEEALKAGGFEGILYPAELPEGVRIERIIHSNDGDDTKCRLNFVLNSENISYRIFLYEKFNSSDWLSEETITINQRVFYVIPITQSGYSQACFEHNGFQYIIVCTDYTILIDILNNIEEQQS